MIVINPDMNLYRLHPMPAQFMHDLHVVAIMDCKSHKGSRAQMHYQSSRMSVLCGYECCAAHLKHQYPVSDRAELACLKFERTEVKPQETCLHLHVFNLWPWSCCARPASQRKLPVIRDDQQRVCALWRNFLALCEQQAAGLREEQSGWPGFRSTPDLQRSAGMSKSSIKNKAAHSVDKFTDIAVLVTLGRLKEEAFLVLPPGHYSLQACSFPVSPLRLSAVDSQVLLHPKGTESPPGSLGSDPR